MTKLETTRRQFLKAAGAGAAAIGASSLLPSDAQAARELRLFCWDGYADTRLHEEFLKQHDTKIKYDLLISDPDAVNRLRAGETKIWDIINLNNPWARAWMWPEGLIVELPRERFEPYFEKMFDLFAPPYKWAMSFDNQHLLGVCQRVGTYDFAINTDAVDWRAAQKEGWDLFNNPDFAGRYGILAYDNWNIMHMLMGAGVHPFKEHTEEEFAKFEKTCRQWLNGAKLISDDFVQMNIAMINGEIDAFVSGGVYSLSAARYDGNWNLLHITPESGPADGHGGINWIELTSAVNNPDFHPKVFDFLEFILQPESAYIVATAGDVLLVVGQMAQPEVRAKFSKDQLRAMQWDDPNGFEYRMSHSVEYDINPDYDAMLDIYLDAKRKREAA